MDNDLIHKSVFIQIRFKYIYLQKNLIAKKLNHIYRIFSTITKNIQFLYLHTVINQSSYNTAMYNLDNIFKYFKLLPRPIHVQDFKDIKANQFNDIIYKICLDLLKSTKKYGCISIADIVILELIFKKRK